MSAIKEILQECIRDDIVGEAAKAAYYFFLSLFPALLAIFALTGIFGGDAAFEWITFQLRLILPGDAAEYLEQFAREVTGDSRPGMLSLGLLLAFWSASNIFTALATGLNRMYDIEEHRTWWKRRAIALAIVIACSILLTGGAVAVLAGPEVLSLFGLKSSTLWSYMRWPLAFILLVTMMWLIYYYLPNQDQRRWEKQILIGAVTGASVWLSGSLGFRIYVTNFSSYSQTYGFVGGVIVLLLWLYLTALAILFGGEVAATLGQRTQRSQSLPKKSE